MIVRQPANFGWPFCITPDEPYVDYDFTPDAPQSGERVQLLRADQRLAQQHRPAAPAAGHPAGRLVLVQHGSGPVPGAVPAERRRQRHRADGRPGDAVRLAASSRRSGGRASSTGSRSSTSGRGTIAKVFELNRPNGNRLVDIHHLFGGAGDPEPRTSCWTTRWTWSSGRTTRSTTLEYGTGYFAELPAAQLARIDYVRNGQYTPVVRASATPASGRPRRSRSSSRAPAPRTPTATA